MAETSFSQPSIDKQALSSQNTAPMRLQIRGGGNYCRKPLYPLEVGSPSPAGGGHRKHISDAHPPCRIASNRGARSRDQNEVMLFVLFANQLEIELPKIVTTPISSTATSAMSRPYSVTAIPSSDFTNLRTTERMRSIVAP